jgi:hypothetical protein
LITRPEESYRLWRVIVCDQETSKKRQAKARYRAVENTSTMGCNARKTNNKQTNISQLLALLCMKFKEKKVTTIIFNFWTLFFLQDIDL